ncbi:FimV family protein [Sedimenticola thiotaurini]|uniref:FimV N-terminal domain-containing protein n=1 Tax=Sedimenticola thiotaurini TaxID=1543721 RepID=A0A0F7JZC4_9GAMM|nr:FimV/HubP family polar landmark protein [Sedimenticola thiotaurini]AKH20250.1 hypothetical protein AAY24_07700 [Sedimenticola thiotaurini]
MFRKSHVLLLLLMPSASVFALGLGGVRVESALNEPLNARVELISVDQTAVEDIRVKLAGPEIFNRAGVARPYLLSKLRFKPVIPEHGSPYIQVSTRDAVREPFLDFLLEVSWPQGNLVREFTILLDPPTYRPPRTESVATQPVQSPAPEADSAAVTTTYGPVQRSETLWVIAGKVFSDAGISRNRAMIGLLRANPDAFRQGNINFLKKGALLRIPTPEEIAAISEAGARVAIKEQMAAWRKGRATAAAPSPAPMDRKPDPRPVQSEVVADPTGTQATVVADGDSQAAQPPAPGEAEQEMSASERKQLRVVEPEENWQLGEKGEAKYPARESDKLREAIKDSEQELVAVQEINKDITELRAALESKVEALRKALEEKDAELEKLRQQIAQTGVTPQTGTGDAAMVPAEPTPPGNVSTSAPVTKQPTDSAGWKDEYWMILMGAVIAVLLLLLLLSNRGRKRQEAYRGPKLFEHSDDPVDASSDKLETSLDDAVEQAEAPMSKVATPSQSMEQKTETSPGKSHDIGSILMEADIYLAYRRYSQAEALVQEAMEENPDSFELKAKLLEIYAFRRDKQSFSRYLDRVYPVLMTQAPELWEKVIDMGQPLVPDHPAWSGGEGEDTIEMTLPPERADMGEDLFAEGSPSGQSPFDLDVDLDELDIPTEKVDPSIFDELNGRPVEPVEDEIPSIDLDLDYENPKDPDQGK